MPLDAGYHPSNLFTNLLSGGSLGSMPTAEGAVSDCLGSLSSYPSTTGSWSMEKFTNLRLVQRHLLSSLILLLRHVLRENAFSYDKGVLAEILEPVMEKEEEVSKAVFVTLSMFMAIDDDLCCSYNSCVPCIVFGGHGQNMSEPSEASDPCALIGIVKNPDGTITRDPPDSPASQPNLTSPLQSYPKTSSYQTSRGCVSTSPPPLRLPKQNSLSSSTTTAEASSPAASTSNSTTTSATSWRACSRGRRVTFVPASSRAQTPGGVPRRSGRSDSDDEWIKSHVYLFNVFPHGTGSVRCESKIRHENDRVFPPAVGDLCWELCLPVGENRDHAYSNPTMGDGLEVLGALKWKVMVCGGGGDPMIDRQRDVAKLMKEKGIHVVECFTDGDVHGAELGDPSKSQTLFASIKSFISSTPYHITVSHSNSTWMRLYVPVTALNDGVSSKKLPLVVYYHGGGFVICSVDFKPFHDFCNRMARELNAVVASPSYRLAPEHRLPAAYDDGVDALRFIRTSDDEWIKSHADLSNCFPHGDKRWWYLAYNVGLRSALADLSPY
ncbi:hypothetical protein HID58_007927, partial [Brassica napus]